MREHAWVQGDCSVCHLIRVANSDPECPGPIYDAPPQLPPRPAPERPGAACVYRSYDMGRTLLYVGYSTNPEMRLKIHQSASAWWPQVYKTEVEWFPTRRAAAEAEKDAILCEFPAHNVAGVHIPYRYPAGID